MKDKAFTRYYLFSLFAVLLASFYPIYMGLSVIVDMLRFGTVFAENYPKYIIPYTPIALSIIISIALLPFAIHFFKKYALLFATAFSTAVFFTSELLLERMVTVTKTTTEIISTLEDWQMYMCYIPPSSFFERTWTDVNVLMGEYSPAFKLHFYIISIVLIFTILNCFYGFAKMIKSGDKSRLKPLILQSISSGTFLSMCILACFTAFYRDGKITVSPLSAVLMSIFFILFGVTMGVYVASFTLNKKKLLSVTLPCSVASLITFIMYIGEMILLNGHLYRFGKGFFFSEIFDLVLAPIDIVIIITAGSVTAIILSLIRNKNEL
ncbi:MAG: hypothetical protein E7491_03145 [Ruminococcaceae bacterium]|nr:hypothetical protein [Oscillospiraceae bacterium]